MSVWAGTVVVNRSDGSGRFFAYSGRGSGGVVFGTRGQARKYARELREHGMSCEVKRCRYRLEVVDG